MTTRARPIGPAALGRMLAKLGACPEARGWVRGIDVDARAAWEACRRVDWMLWLLTHAGLDSLTVARLAAAGARTAVDAFVRAGEARPAEALDALAAWADDPTPMNAARVWASLDEVSAFCDTITDADFGVPVHPGELNAAMAAYYATLALDPDGGSPSMDGDIVQTALECVVRAYEDATHGPFGGDIAWAVAHRDAGNEAGDILTGIIRGVVPYETVLDLVRKELAR